MSVDGEMVGQLVGAGLGVVATAYGAGGLAPVLVKVGGVVGEGAENLAERGDVFKGEAAAPAVASAGGPPGDWVRCAGGVFVDALQFGTFY